MPGGGGGPALHPGGGGGGTEFIFGVGCEATVVTEDERLLDLRGVQGLLPSIRR